MSQAGEDLATRKWARRAGGFFGVAGLISLAVACEIAVLGGFVFYVGGFRLSATHVWAPLAVALACFGLERLIAKRSFDATRIARLSFWLWRERRSAKGRATWAVLVACALVGAFRQGWQAYYIHEAERLDASAQSAKAAIAYEKAVLWLDPQEQMLRERAAYAHFREGAFGACVDGLLPVYREGRILTVRGYRALWNCLSEEGRKKEALEVARAAVGRHTQLEKEGTGAIAILERELLREQGIRYPVSLVWKAPAEPRLVVAGNWGPRGDYAEVDGYQSTPMSFDPAKGVWSLEIPLATSGSFPYFAVVRPIDEGSESAPLAMTQFWVADQAMAPTFLAPKPSGYTGEFGGKQATADGRRRVIALWPDAGSWFLLNSYVQRGLMPNAASLLKNGARGEMISTNPPFTATAYVRMVNLSGEAGRPLTNLETIFLQLKGIPFFDRLFSDDLVAGTQSGPTLFSVLGDNGHRAVNLVFSDTYIAAEGDLKANDGTVVKIDPKALEHQPPATSLGSGTYERIAHEILRVDPVAEPGRAALLKEQDVLAFGLENNELKGEAGLSVWRDDKPNFMLLRFPAIDILSHRYYSDVESNFEENAMVEAYRHLDRWIGRLRSQLDADDTFILVSDHGIRSTLHHDPVCVLAVEGPGLSPNTTFDTIPIAHFPLVVLSRFGIEQGSERLTDSMFELLYQRKRSPDGIAQTQPTPSNAP